MKKAMLVVCGFVFALVVVPSALSQSYAGMGAKIEPTMLIDKPTAGMLKRGNYSITSNYYQRGGVLVGVAVGIIDQFSFGISYGGTEIIGPNKIEMNPGPEVNAKLRLFDETLLMPAIAIGFDSQGKEPYLKEDTLKRFTVKSPGVYVAGSKNYAFMGNLSIHGGLNLSMETGDGDKDMNAYVGAEKTLGNDISILAEYDFAFNDNHNNAVGEGRGYLNLGLRWAWGKGLVIGLDLKNVTKNQKNIFVGNRTLQIDYVGSF
ncbi:MAG: hypothetical protein HYY49_13650 [Ignavibacteriales bacterium]|nr:hypothetical protein [Ignavibacteriales bacterium]